MLSSALNTDGHILDLYPLKSTGGAVKLDVVKKYIEDQKGK